MVISLLQTLPPSYSLCPLHRQPSFSTGILSWVSSPPALSLPQMFSILSRFIPLTLKRASPCFHLCLHSLQGKFLLLADLFLTSKEIQLSIDSDWKAEQNISEQHSLGSCATCPHTDEDLCQTKLHYQTVQKGSCNWHIATAHASALRAGLPAHPDHRALTQDAEAKHSSRASEAGLKHLVSHRRV